MPEIFRYEIRRESDKDWMDITGLINSADTSITDALCTTEWKSATNTASFSLRYADRTLFKTVLSYLLTVRDEGGRIEVRITSISSGNVVFSGYLDDSSIAISSGKIPDALALSARDSITILDNKITEDIVYENEPIQSVIMAFLQKAGWSGGFYSELPADRILPYLVVTSDEGKTYREIIDDILFECCGYVLHRDAAQNRFEIRKIVPEAEPERIIHYVISDTLSTESEIFDNDGVRIEYPTVSVKGNTVLYVSDIQTSVENGELKGEEIQPGHYYPSDGDITPTYQEYDSSLLDRAYQTSQSRKQNEDISLLYAKNARVNINPGDGFDFPLLPNVDLDANPAFYPRKARVLIRNSTSAVRDLLAFTIEGDAVYKSKLNKVLMPSDSMNPEEYETKHIYTESDAVAFGNFYLNFKRLSSAVSTWTEKEPVSVLGEKVIVQHKGTDIAQAHVVVQITDESFSGGVRCYRVTAVSVSGYSEYSWATESSAGSVISKQIASDTQQYYYSTSYEQLQDGTWLDSPQDAAGRALWIRRKIVYTDGSIWLGDPYCVSNKPDDTAPKYYYKYTKTNEPDAWKDGTSAILIHGRMVSIHGATLILGTSKWYDHIPEGDQYKNDFLWTKIVHADGSVDIVPPAKQGEPAYGIELIAEPESYQLTTRGVVKDDPAIINLSIRRSYVTAPAVWAITPSDNENISLHVESTDSDKATVTILNGAEISSFTVTVEIEEKEIIKASKIIQGIDGGVAKAHYFGIYPEDPDDALPIYHKDTEIFDVGNAVFPDYVKGEGKVMKGDYIIFKTTVITGTGEDQQETIEPMPYYYTGSSWLPLTENAENYSEIMGSVLGDIVKMPDMPVTTGALYGFFRNLAAYSAFIENLFSRYIKLIAPGAIYAGSYNEDGTLVGGTKGFHLSSAGILQAVEAILMKATVSGSFFCQDEVGTVFYTALATLAKTLICSAKTRWSFADFLENVSLPLSVTYKNATYSAERFSESVQAVSSLSGDVDENTFTIPFSGTYRVDITIRYDGYITIRKNNVYIYDSQDYVSGNSYTGSATFYFEKGDKIDLYADALGTGDISQSVAKAVLTLDRSAVFFIQNGEVEYVFYDDTPYFVAESLSAPGFNSAEHLRFASINGWYDNVPTADSNLPVATGTAIKINDETHVITAVVKRTGVFTVLTAEGVYISFDAPSGTEEFEHSGWYDIEGDIPIMANNRGIYSENLYPITSGTTSLGDADVHFGAGYIDNVHSDQLYGNLNSEDTREDYKVWGAVAN